MNAGKIKAVLFIIVFLLVVALVCAWVTGGDSTSKEPVVNNDPITVPLAPTPNPGVQTPSTSAPQPGDNQPQTPPQSTSAPQNNNSGEVQNPVPTATPTPAPSEAPAATPAPSATAAPQPTTAPASGSPIASGSFSSNTGTGLNMRADWSVVVTGNNTATVTVNVYAISYSLYLTESDSGLKISLGNQYASAGTTALSYDGNSQKTTLLGTKSFAVDTSKGNVSLPLAIEWHYMGSYGGVAIDVIECGGNIAFG